MAKLTQQQYHDNSKWQTVEKTKQKTGMAKMTDNNKNMAT